MTANRPPNSMPVSRIRLALERHAQAVAEPQWHEVSLRTPQPPPAERVPVPPPRRQTFSQPHYSRPGRTLLVRTDRTSSEFALLSRGGSDVASFRALWALQRDKWCPGTLSSEIEIDECMFPPLHARFSVSREKPASVELPGSEEESVEDTAASSDSGGYFRRTLDARAGVALLWSQHAEPTQEKEDEDVDDEDSSDGSETTTSSAGPGAVLSLSGEDGTSALCGEERLESSWLQRVLERHERAAELQATVREERQMSQRPTTPPYIDPPFMVQRTFLQDDAEPPLPMDSADAPFQMLSARARLPRRPYHPEEDRGTRAHTTPQRRASAGVSRRKRPFSAAPSLVKRGELCGAYAVALRGSMASPPASERGFRRFDAQRVTMGGTCDDGWNM